jgi:putative oligomerization/nucleic acid binding protein
MGGLIAARAANRAGMRQSYRTAARMQRRRSYMASKMGVRQDFAPAQEEAPPPAAAAPQEPQYVAELERLAQLRDQGVITGDDFEAKKKQLLGI